MSMSYGKSLKVFFLNNQVIKNVTRNNVRNYGKILNDWFSAGKKKTLKLGHFPRCSTVYIKHKSKNSQHNRSWCSQHPHSVVQQELMSMSQYAVSVYKIIQSVFFKETINSNNYVQLLITQHSREFKEEKQHGYGMHENATTHSVVFAMTALENTFRE
jgi:hypothetical protein